MKELLIAFAILATALLICKLASRAWVYLFAAGISAAGGFILYKTSFVATIKGWVPQDWMVWISVLLLIIDGIIVINDLSDRRPDFRTIVGMFFLPIIVVAGFQSLSAAKGDVGGGVSKFGNDVSNSTNHTGR